MISLDQVIATMKATDCVNCTLEEATFDRTGEKVVIEGSFCTPAPGYDMIQIFAKNIETGEEIWTKECETGITCNIPFTSNFEFNCSEG